MVSIINAKPVFKPLSFQTENSFNIRVDSGENLKNSWHYHREIELILLKRSEGTRIIGNSVGSFKDNDVFVIGKNIPHVFLHEEKNLQNCFDEPQEIVIQFYETFLGNDFLNLPEFKLMHHLFTVAKHGLCLTDQAKESVIPLIEKMLQVSPIDRLLLLLQILRVIVDKSSYSLLCNEGIIKQLKVDDYKRIDKVLDYTFENYDQNIKIEQVAQIINLTKESFCRFFKAKTGKSYFEFLIEIRIDKACQMILQNHLSIKEIAFACGFESLSNFHLQFKKIVKQSPVEFKISNLIQERTLTA
jgi:AraC-like DNA-binding protein